MEGIIFAVYLAVSYVVMLFAMIVLLAICLFNDERQKEAGRAETVLFCAAFLFVWLFFAWLLFPIAVLAVGYLLAETKFGPKNVSTSPLWPLV